MKKKLIIILISLLILLILIYVSLLLIVNYHKHESQIPVFMYHDIIMDEYYQDKPDTISLSVFEKQLKYLKDNNYKTLTLDELYDWKVNNKSIPEKSVVLTFDDGFYSFHYLVEPLLEKYNMHASCFIIGDITKEITPEYNPEKYGTIGTDIINNHNEYTEYASHSYGLHKTEGNNKRIEVLTKKGLEEDFDNMKNIYDFKYLSYPFNTDTKDAREVLKEKGYKLAFRGESEKVTKSANNYQIPRIGAYNDYQRFVNVLETDDKNNRYGNGLLRKVMITIERKLGKRLFK